MANQIPPTHITEDVETLEEVNEAQRIDALPMHLQQLVLTHQLDQFDAVPNYLQQQAGDFVQFCDALGIQSEEDSCEGA